MASLELYDVVGEDDVKSSLLSLGVAAGPGPGRKTSGVQRLSNLFLPRVVCLCTGR